MALCLVSNDVSYCSVKKVSNEGSVTHSSEVREQESAVRFGPVSKRFQIVGFRGSTLEKQASEIFHFGYGKALNNKMVPDPVGSGSFFFTSDSIRQNDHRIAERVK